MMHDHSPSWFVLRSKATANISYEALLPAVIFTSLASFMVMLRWCSRLYSRSAKVGVEDYFVTAAMMFSVGFTAVVGGEFSINGLTLEEGTRNSPLLSTMLKLVLVQAILYHLASNLVKASFILQYIRLFSLVAHMRCICNVLIVLVFGATAWGILGNIFLCRPVRSYWDVKTPGKCLDKEQHFWSTSIIGILLDFAIWLLPIPVVGRLKLPKRQKIGLVMVFGLGGFLCIITLLRLILVHKAAHSGEVTRCGTYAIIFSSIEINVAIICASLLVMKPLFARFLPCVVSEEAMSAAEDGRTCRALTGLHLLSGDTVDDAEKPRSDGRKDTLMQTSSPTLGMITPKEFRKVAKAMGNHKRNSM